MSDTLATPTCPRCSQGTLPEEIGRNPRAVGYCPRCDLIVEPATSIEATPLPLEIPTSSADRVEREQPA